MSTALYQRYKTGTNRGLRTCYLTSTTMFKTAATKIAHNSTLPALAGNQDLRPLQDLITAEKTVLISYVHVLDPITALNADDLSGYRNSVLITQKLQRRYGHGV